MGLFEQVDGLVRKKIEELGMDWDGKPIKIFVTDEKLKQLMEYLSSFNYQPPMPIKQGYLGRFGNADIYLVKDMMVEP